MERERERLWCSNALPADADRAVQGFEKEALDCGHVIFAPTHLEGNVELAESVHINFHNLSFQFVLPLSVSLCLALSFSLTHTHIHIHTHTHKHTLSHTNPLVSTHLEGNVELAESVQITFQRKCVRERVCVCVKVSV